MQLTGEALAAKHLVLGSVGSHAGEAWREIVTRKKGDIKKAGHSVWVLNSNAARPDAVQAFCEETGARYVLFLRLQRPVKRSGAGLPVDAEGPGTLRDVRAQTYSANNSRWLAIDSKLTPVTGDIKRSTTGLLFDAIEEAQSSISLDLTSFVKHHDGEALTRFWPSDSAYPVRREKEARSGRYRVLAVGRLAAPFAVWLRA